METMFLIPGLPAGAMLHSKEPQTPTTKKSQQPGDTHDTCSCGSDNHKPSQSPLSCGSQTCSTFGSPLNGSTQATHLRTTVSTATIVKPAFAILPQDVAAELVEKTELRVDHALKKASPQFQTANAVDPVPKLSLAEDLTRGDLLGSGGFASVHAVAVKDPRKKLRFHAEGQQYVVKHLSPKLVASATATTLETAAQQTLLKRKLHAGCKDIVLESHILSALNHRHIVTVHGLSAGGLQAFGTTRQTDAYFMILPRLNCTLADKISAWKRKDLLAAESSKEVVTAKSSSSWWPLRKRSSTAAKQAQQAQELEFLCERLEIVLQLAEALEYLHSKRIMHRDVKPPNIGFDNEGCLKLFDFGLAKELPADAIAYTSAEVLPPKTTANGTTKTFPHLGNTGTTRYMAPEVIRREPYNCNVDVYACSIVTWELLTLQKPYGADVSGQFVKECVAIYDDRPCIPTGKKNKWPKALKKLVQQGWTKDITYRLTATQYKDGLKEIVAKKQHQHAQAVESAAAALAAETAATTKGADHDSTTIRISASSTTTNNSALSC